MNDFSPVAGQTGTPIGGQSPNLTTPPADETLGGAGADGDEADGQGDSSLPMAGMPSVPDAVSPNETGRPANGEWASCQQMSAYWAGQNNNDNTRVCVESVETVEAWSAVSIEEDAGDFRRSTKYFLPWNSSYIPPSILDANRSNFPLVPGDRKSDFQVQKRVAPVFWRNLPPPPADGAPSGPITGWPGSPSETSANGAPMMARRYSPTALAIPKRCLARNKTSPPRHASRVQAETPSVAGFRRPLSPSAPGRLSDSRVCLGSVTRQTPGYKMPGAQVSGRGAALASVFRSGRPRA